MIFLKNKNKNKHKKLSSSYCVDGQVGNTFDLAGFEPRFAQPIDQLGLAASDEFGHGNALMGEIANRLDARGILIPKSFGISKKAFQRFIHYNRLDKPIANVLASIESNLPDLLKKTQLIRNLILEGKFPDELVEELQFVYSSLAHEQGDTVRVSVRNSPLANGVPNVQLAAEQSALLNLHNVAQLIEACRRVFAEAFNERAVAHCIQKGIDPRQLSVALNIQTLIRADLGVAGVMLTMEGQSGFPSVISISSSYGFGEIVANGRVNPDEFLVFKPTLEQGYKSIVKRQLGDKSIMRVLAEPGEPGLQDVSVSAAARKQFSISDDEVMQLALYGCEVERHCTESSRNRCAIEIEWAKDGETGEFYVLQAVPAPANVTEYPGKLSEYRLLDSGWVLARGHSVGHKIVTGFARVIRAARDMDQLQPGEILITTGTDPQWESVLAKAAAIVTDTGGRMSHAATAAQELGVPAIVGCESATGAIATGSIVTVVCGEQDWGCIYDGELAYQVEERDYSAIVPTSTHLKLNLNSPDRAYEYAALPVDGVGLFTIEGIIEKNIGVHPRGLLEYELQTPEIQFDIDHLVDGYPDRRAFYIQRLAEGIGRVGSAFYPRPVTVRFSDFRTNEYAALFAGETYEAQEANPKIGLRGAARYLSPEFAESFALECEAIRYVRKEMGLTNIHVVVPFVRTPAEGEAIKAVLEAHGLKSSKGFKISMMCETPANVLLADEFLEVFDGFIVGTSDLLELTVGVDRDNPAFRETDERNVALLKMIYLAKDACQRAGKSIDICGEASTEHPELIRWMIEQGVESLSFSAHRYFDMHKVVLATEENLFNSDTQEFKADLKASA